MKVKMLNFFLTTSVILQVVANFKSSCSPVFCVKSVLRLTLVHSKYVGHEKIDKIRTQRGVNFSVTT